MAENSKIYVMWEEVEDKEESRRKERRECKSVVQEIQKRAVNTWTSQAVPHLSTNHALNRLTSEFEWDPVH